MEDYEIGSYFPSYSLSSVFDLSEDKNTSVGFMELLGVQNMQSMLDLPPVVDEAVKKTEAPLDEKKECSEVLNSQQPATPNSSSISSASSEALNDELTKTVDQANNSLHKQ
jgi:hypothetical protein